MKNLRPWVALLLPVNVFQYRRGSVPGGCERNILLLTLLKNVYRQKQRRDVVPLDLGPNAGEVVG